MSIQALHSNEKKRELQLPYLKKYTRNFAITETNK